VANAVPASCRAAIELIDRLFSLPIESAVS
jgi:hypothetical protein